MTLNKETTPLKINLRFRNVKSFFLILCLDQHEKEKLCLYFLLFMSSSLQYTLMVFYWRLSDSKVSGTLLSIVLLLLLLSNFQLFFRIIIHFTQRLVWFRITTSFLCILCIEVFLCFFCVFIFRSHQLYSYKRNYFVKCNFLCFLLAMLVKYFVHLSFSWSYPGLPLSLARWWF